MCSVSIPGESPFHFRSTNPVMNFYSKQSPQLGVLVISWPRQTFRPVCLVLCQSHGAWGEKDNTVTRMWHMTCIWLTWLTCDTWPTCDTWSACDSCDLHVTHDLHVTRDLHVTHVTRDLHVTHVTDMWHVICMWLMWPACDTWLACDMWPACDSHMTSMWCIAVFMCGGVLCRIQSLKRASKDVGDAKWMTWCGGWFHGHWMVGWAYCQLHCTCIH